MTKRDLYLANPDARRRRFRRHRPGKHPNGSGRQKSQCGVARLLRDDEIAFGCRSSRHRCNRKVAIRIAAGSGPQIWWNMANGSDRDNLETTIGIDASLGEAGDAHRHLQPRLRIQTERARDQRAGYIAVPRHQIRVLLAVDRHKAVRGDPLQLRLAGQKIPQFLSRHDVDAAGRRCTCGPRRSSAFAPSTQFLWREIWLFHKAGRNWKIDVVPPADDNPEPGSRNLRPQPDRIVQKQSRRVNIATPGNHTLCL